MPRKKQPAPLPPAGVAFCDRCRKPLRVAESRNEHSAPFRLAKVPSGVCAECVMTQFLYNTYPVNMIIDEAGPEMLLNAGFMRMAFTQAGILQNCDMDIAEIDWQRLVDNWKLPVKITRDGRNPYRMGDSPRAGKGRGGMLPPLGFHGPPELPPGVKLSGGTLIVDVTQLKGGEGGLADAILGLVEEIKLSKRKPS